MKDCCLKKCRGLITAVVVAMTCTACIASESEDLLASATQALRRGETKEALSLATKAVDADPKNAEAYLTLAAVRDAMHDFDKAVELYGQAIRLSPDLIRAYQQRGEDEFRLGRFRESVADFDKAVELKPAGEPYHWQRGISLYYAGQFERGAKQFDLHKSVNPNDVENAVWHYLCVAQASGVDQARKGLMPIQGDARVPLMQIHALFAGKATADDVLTAARAGNPARAELNQRLFYAHLYIGLYEEANGHLETARRNLLLAEKYADEGYMGDVARVHRALLNAPDKPRK